MKSSILSTREFFQLTVNSLLELCTHCIDGHRIVSIEGRLLLALETGDKVELNIQQQDVSSLSTSVKPADTKKSSLAQVSDVDKNLEVNLSNNVETGLAMKNEVGLENLNSVHVGEANVLASADETYLHSSSVDDGEQSFPDLEGVPSAVLQTNGEFMCSCCGVMMKCARAIKRHISTHMNLQSFQPPTTLSCETSGDADDISSDEVTQSRSEEQLTACRRLPTSGISPDSRKRLQKQESNKDIGTKWRSYPCKDCDKIFTASALLQRHRAQMHKPNQCQKCSMVLAGSWNFSQHVRKEHPGLQICKAQKLYVCEYCSRSFVCSSLLRDHISTVHLGTVQHRCDQCGKVLVSASSLRLHRRQVHELDYKRTCDGCGRQFSRTTALLDHMTNAHPHLLPDKYRGRADKLACKQCALKFTTHGSLKRHVEVRHSDAPRHRCPVCSRAFRCHRYVVRHVRLHHPGITDGAAADSRAVLVDAINEDSAVTVK